MLLLKNYPSRRSSSTFQPRRRSLDAYNRRSVSSSSESESESEELSYKPRRVVYEESETDLDSEEEEEVRPIKGKLYKRNNAKLQRYFTPGTGREVIENLVPRGKQSHPFQRGSLDAQKLDVKKIEYRKKIDIVWNSIISKYSAYDENDQGDIINLKDFSIEEDTGHIEKLQNFQRTNIWNDINEFEDVHDGGYDYDDDIDPSEDPINLLSNGKPTRVQSKRSTPQPTMKPPRLLKAQPPRAPREELSNDPLSLLTPKNTSKLPTRSTSPLITPSSNRASELLSLQERIKLLKSGSANRRSETSSAEERRRHSSPERSPSPPPLIDLTNDPISLLTPQKSSRITTRLSSPRRHSSGSIQHQEVELSSPLYSMLPPPTRTSGQSTSNIVSQQQPTSPFRPTISRSTSDDPILLLSPKPRVPIKLPTPPKSAEKLNKYPITAIPLDKLTNHLAEFYNGKKTFKGKYERSVEQRCRDMVKNGSGTRHSSPVRQLMATFSLVASHKQMENSAPSSANKKYKRSSHRRAPRSSETIRRMRNDLISSRPENSDPINLLTPRVTSRIGSRRPTRAASPLRARRTPRYTGQNESDPICLLTPRSSHKRPTPRINSPSRLHPQHDPSNQEYPYHQKQMLPPPPSFQLPNVPGSMSRIDEQGPSPFIAPSIPNNIPPPMFPRYDAPIDTYEAPLQQQFAPFPVVMMYPAMVPPYPYVMDPALMNFSMNGMGYMNAMNQRYMDQRYMDHMYPPVDDYTFWRNEYNKRERITPLDNDPIDLLTR